jgi:uncharacterized membrane protein
MEIATPKEIVQNLTGNPDEKKSSVFSIKAKSTLNGAFFGAAFGLMYTYHKQKNLYVGALIGALVGGFVSNVLTIKR